MGIIFGILPLSIIIALAILAAYFWSVRSGQFDDLETPAMRMLFDDDDDDEPRNQRKTDTKS